MFRHLRERGRRKRFNWLLLCLVVVCYFTNSVHSARVASRSDAVLTQIRRKTILAKRSKRAREARREAWEERSKLAPQRPRIKRCVSGVESTSSEPETVRCYFEGLQVSLMDDHGLGFCRNCPDPHAEGGFMEVWEAHHGVQDFHEVAEMVYAVPNDASEHLLNAVGGTVVLCDRGGVSFVDKARYAQEAGALALVVIDTKGACKDGFDCSDWLGSSEGGRGLAHSDPASKWEDVYIPVVLVTESDGKRLRSMMNLESIDMHQYGVQHFVPEPKE